MDGAEHSQIRRVQQQFRKAREYASEFEGLIPKVHYFNTRLKRVAETLSGFDRGRILSCGCGPAKDGAVLSQQTHPVLWGFYPSEDMIKLCRDTYGDDPYCHFFIGTVETLPFPPLYFDVVICPRAFEYFTDGQRALREIGRVLKPAVSLLFRCTITTVRIGCGGDMVGVKREMASLGLPDFFPTGLRSEEQKPAAAYPAFHVYTENSLRKLLAAENLETERLDSTSISTFSFLPWTSAFPQGLRGCQQQAGTALSILNQGFRHRVHYQGRKSCGRHKNSGGSNRPTSGRRTIFQRCLRSIEQADPELQQTGEDPKRVQSATL